MKTDLSKIIDIKILPPMAIARMGSASEPMEAYVLEINKENPLDFRTIKKELSFNIGKDGQISVQQNNDQEELKFKSNDNLIKPMAPFFEVWARYEDNSDVYVPLVLKKDEDISCLISFEVHVENHKIYRRTHNNNDKIVGKASQDPSHFFSPIELRGNCNNFLTGKTLPMGVFQCIRPIEDEHNELNRVRFRFTPPHGKVYGPDKPYLENLITKKILDEAYTEYFHKINADISTNFHLYDTEKKDENYVNWGYYKESSESPLGTNPGSIYAGYSDEDGNQCSLGLFDDASDGYISISLKIDPHKTLTARASITVAPPAFAPDLVFVRVVSDELTQLLEGPEIQQDQEVYVEDIQEILRRAFETIRLMNTAIMNGNPYYGEMNLASNMPKQDSRDTHRVFEPVMQPETVDNHAIRILHEKIYNSLETGIAPWFINSIRMPDEIGKMDNSTRRKMPAMMRGADARALTLTYRQINTIIKAIMQGSLKKRGADESEPIHTININNLVQQLHYRGLGNPYHILPAVAVSNCFPGLEYDFRNLWTRTFEGIRLSENTCYVLETDQHLERLFHCQLVGINNHPTMVQTTGPQIPNSANNAVLSIPDNPDATTFMEWSNSLVYTITQREKEVICFFSAKPINQIPLVTKEELEIFLSEINIHGKTEFITAKGIKLQYKKLRIRSFFDQGSAVPAQDLIEPGDFTRGLCSPWQNDFKECACYYWAASRPDYVNIKENNNGFTEGDNWMAKERTGHYIPDSREDSHFLSYTDLFESWEQSLHFIIKGNDEIIKK